MRLRREFPWAPVVATITDLANTGTTPVALLANRVGCRLVEAEANTSLRRLRSALNREGDLPTQVPIWLGVHRPRLRKAVIRRVEALFRAGTESRTVADVAEAECISVDGLETLFRRAKLAPPSRYLRFGALAPAVLEYARGDGKRLERIALERGFQDASSFSRGVLREFGVRPHGLRAKLLGSEWLAWCAGLDRA